MSTARVTTPINSPPSSSAGPVLDIEPEHAAPARRLASPGHVQLARLAVRPGDDNAGDARLCLAFGVGALAVGGVFTVAGATNDDSSSRGSTFYTASLFGVIGLSAAGKGIHSAFKAMQQRRTGGQDTTPAVTPVNAGRQEMV